ncbi:SusC/RagA family TonB-linked outer membrane protein [Chitinophaga eiseniae]|uniref:SusC/RagA family TonB-linked outer membrane protein n=1 Tax=Chitinophaga eiseniae TaxID=634771 RepID=A0A847SBU6_9BACT|nr:SusC/RagA family TonB-linked outer membrane protein [Chitinophaga eiseniae]NLR80680.1 SusC/RagA family TonB-linked outer membrane protein [Chitinophaga eiseniae]
MRKLVMAFIALLAVLPSVAQTVKVTGTITDERSGPLPGASVKIKGGSQGVITNDKGEFAIMALPDATLEISFIGYLKQEQKLKGRSHLSIVLTQKNGALEDVVVIGYQTVNRRKATAAVSSIRGKDIENIPAGSFEQLLQGRMSGVNVQNFTGEPGAAPTISVRGNTAIGTSYQNNQYKILNKPLYVIDDVPQFNDDMVGPDMGTGTNNIAGLNPNEIESVDVLKDAAAAAVYGSRGANGVIIIKTKRARTGSPRFSISTYGGLTEIPKLRTVLVGAAERREKIRLYDDAFAGNQDRLIHRNLIMTDSLNPDLNKATDWQRLFYRNGFIRNVDLNVYGGTEYNTYRLSAGYYKEDGIVKASGFTRYTLNYSSSIRTKNGALEVIPNIRLARMERGRGSGSADLLGAVGQSMPSSLFAADDNSLQRVLGRYNSNMDINTDNQVNGDISFNLRLSRQLSFRSRNSVAMVMSRRDVSVPGDLNADLGNSASSNSGLQQSYTTSNDLNWNAVFGKAKEHTINAIVGQEVQYSTYQNTYARGDRGASDQIQVVNGFPQGPYLYGSSSYSAFGILSLFSRINYDYKSTYLLSASLRGDAASSFGPNNKWGYFPAVSAGWIISNEPFMRRYASWLSLLKLRGSYGVLGNLPGDYYLQYSLYNIGGAGYNGSNLNPNTYNGTVTITPQFGSGGVAQKDISWEKTGSWNGGIEAELMNGKYYFSADVYVKNSKAGLIDMNLQSTTGIATAKTNGAQIRNSGIDINFQFRNVLPEKSALRWEILWNVSMNKNLVVNLPNDNRDITFGNLFNTTHILTRGKAVNTFYLLKTLGVYATDDDVPTDKYTGKKFQVGAVNDPNANNPFRAGEFIFADLDGDGIIDAFNGGISGDKIPYGNPNPFLTGGITQNFYWKNFTFGFLCTFTFKRDVLNLYDSDTYGRYGWDQSGNEFSKYAVSDLSKMNIWRKPGDKAEYARMDIGTYRYYYRADQTFFLEKGDYFRIKNISMGYALSQKALKPLHLSRLRFYGLMDNVYIFQASKKLPDAENVNPYGEYNGVGYPSPHKYTLGIDVGF